MELTAGVKKRKPGGWNVVAPSTPKPVMVEEAPIVEMSLNWTILVDVLEKVFGTKARWHQVDEGAANITDDERIRLLQEALGGLPVNIENVRALVAGLAKRNSQGWALSVSFGVLARVAEEWLAAERGIKIEPEKKPNDGFQRGLIDPEAAVARILAAGYRQIPRGADDPKLLQVALGNIPLTDDTARQLWLTLAYYWKETLGGKQNGSDIMPPASRWILACLCHWVNTNHIQIHNPSCFSFADSIAFSS
jgi:hypothetical protein